tara:strand:+ start:8097 stop:8570 length:474 start_codon:yes stop_codon:yes gene_type:complete
MDHIQKLKHTIDALFGTGVSKKLPKDIEIKISKKTGRIRSVYHNGILLFTTRTDGGLALTVTCAELFLNKKFRENCLEIDLESKPFVEEGRSVFCQHVISCGKNVKIGSDVPVLYKNRVIGVGKAVLSSNMILEQKRGVAIKIRDSLKSHISGESSS